MLPEVTTWLLGIFAVLVIGAALVYILGFIVTMIGTMFYLPIVAIAHADIHMPHMHMPHMHVPHMHLLHRT